MSSNKQRIHKCDKCRNTFHINNMFIFLEYENFTSKQYCINCIWTHMYKHYLDIKLPEYIGKNTTYNNSAFMIKNLGLVDDN